MVLKTTENAIIGVNTRTLVTESDGRQLGDSRTGCLLSQKLLGFNIIAMIRDSRFLLLQYGQPYYLDESPEIIDYDLDVKVSLMVKSVSWTLKNIDAINAE